MISFAKNLWDSIFTPGTTPALVKATHLSFTGLVITICVMFYITHSLHFIALLVLSSGLWAAVTWFIGELEAMRNEQQNTVGASPENGAADTPVKSGYKHAGDGEFAVKDAAGGTPMATSSSAQAEVADPDKESVRIR